MKILIADDDDVARGMLKRMLATQFNFTYVEAENGLEALELLSSSSFAFALLDMSMPILSGLEVLEAVRSSPQLRWLPIAFVTSNTDEPTVQRVIQLGITDYLTKPLRA